MLFVHSKTSNKVGKHKTHKTMGAAINVDSPIYPKKMFQIKGFNSEDTMTAIRFKQNFKTAKPQLNVFRNSLSYSCALIWNSIPLEIRI